MYPYFRIAMLVIAIIQIFLVLISYLKLRFLLKDLVNQDKELHEIELQVKPFLKRISVSAYILIGDVVIFIIAEIFRHLFS